MRKLLVVSIAIFTLIALAYSATAWANCGMCGVGETKEGEVINDTCPVMGGKIGKDTPYKTEYKGRTIGFCCPDCIAKFNADPEKYMANIKRQCIIKCPKCGAEIDVKEECKKMGKTCPMMEEKTTTESPETHPEHQHQ